jgi:hypothetical protein
MKPKHYDVGDNSASMERLSPSGMYLIECRVRGELYDKVRCDDYQDALWYFTSFKAIARGAA